MADEIVIIDTNDGKPKVRVNGRLMDAPPPVEVSPEVDDEIARIVAETVAEHGEPED